MGIAGVGLPGGLVTFLFTDIERSTRLLADLGPAYDDMLDRHHETLRAVWQAHRGHEVNTEGDAFFVSFASADDALAACVEGQRALARTTWPDGAEVRVRMGLHTGYAQPRHDDYSALAVNQAARIVSAAHGGQIVLTEDTRSALTDPTSVRLDDRGRFRVRDFEQPVSLHVVAADGWIDPGRPLRVRPAEGHNLVPFLTDMVDREEERAWLAHTVTAGALVTIAGPGGGGKTRLAIEFGLDAAADWPDGVWFVDLSLVHSPDHVTEALADAVGAVPTPGRPVIEDLRAHLAQRQLLVVADNCEHVLDEVARVVHDVQSTCAGMGVLATSRMPLGLAHENVLRLRPLPYGAPDSPAVQLFLASASAVRDEDVPVVQTLCERLDGIPLALELAAARTRTVPPDAILSRLESDPAVVHTADPTRPDRHRSLDRVLDWSWDLLEEPARAALRRLAVLPGTFDMETAVVAVSDETIPGDDVAELLWTLLDHSLVVADVASGSSRYRVLRPVRAHARARSDDAEAERTVRALGRHLDSVIGPARVGSRTWAGKIAVELDNARGVAAELAGIDDELGLELVWAIARHHDLVNAYATCIAEIEAALERHPVEGPARVGLLSLQAYVHLRMGALDAAAPLLEQADELADRVGQPVWDEVGLLRTHGDHALRSGFVGTAVSMAERALATATNDASQSRCWNLLGLAFAQRGDLGRASEAFERELETATRAGLETSLAKIHGNIAEAAMLSGDDERAAFHQLECLAAARGGGEPVLVAYSLMVAARLIERNDGELERAAMLHEAALQALEQAGHVLYPVDAGGVDDLRSSVEASLGAEVYGAAADDGRRRPLGEVADIAQQVLEGFRRQGE